VARAGAGVVRDAGVARDAAPARPRRRLAWSLVPVGGLACAAAVVAVVALRPPDAAPPPAGDGPAAVAQAPADAGQVLRLAAAEARKEPVLPAKPGQFVYVHSRVAWASANAAEDGKGEYVAPKGHERRIWLSVDGKLPGLLREQGQDGDIPLDANVPPAYRADLPTDEKGMTKYLYRDTANDPKKRSPHSMAWTKVGDTLREQYLTPDSVAALFDAAAAIPGSKTVSQVDLAGRKGIAVSRTDAVARHDLIFDRSTYRFLGERDVVVGDLPGIPKGAVTGFTAQLEIAIVDRAGQRP
jgi:hypothetical protein